MINKIKKVIYVLIILILLPILFIASVILIDSCIHPNEVPSFFGWKPFIVMSDSMEPNINSGDIVIAKESDLSNLKQGDIISFKENEIVITHRIHKVIEENGIKKYVTKGDNNFIEDEGYVLESQIEGVYKTNIARVGNFAMFIQTPLGIIISLSIPVIIIGLIQLKEFNEAKKAIKKDEEEKEKLKQELNSIKEKITK